MRVRKGDFVTRLFSRTCLKELEERRATWTWVRLEDWRGERPWRGLEDECLLIRRGVVGRGMSGSGELDWSRSRRGWTELIARGAKGDGNGGGGGGEDGTRESTD